VSQNWKEVDGRRAGRRRKNRARERKGERRTGIVSCSVRRHELDTALLHRTKKLLIVLSKDLQREKGQRLAF
jgi:hypothetical protein